MEKLSCVELCKKTIQILTQDYKMKLVLQINSLKKGMFARLLIYYLDKRKI